MSTSDQPPAADDVARYRQGMRVFQAHSAVAAGSLTLILAVNLLTNLSAGTARDVSAWWSLWAILGWSAGLGVHGLVVWLARPVTDSDDELEAQSPSTVSVVVWTSFSIGVFLPAGGNRRTRSMFRTEGTSRPKSDR